MMGAEDFGDITGVARMQFEQLTGIMGEEFEATKEIFNRAQARMSELEGRDVTLKETLEKLSADPGSLLTDEQIETLSTTPSGDPMMEVAKQTLMATQTVGDLLGGQISGALNWIGGGVTSMTNAIVNEFMGFVGNNADAREAIEEAQNETVALGGQLSDLQEELRAEEAKGAGGDADKIKEIEGDIVRTERMMDAYAQMQSDIQSGVVGADEARGNFLLQAYGGAEVMTQVRESVLSGEGVQPGAAITNAAVTGQLNSAGSYVNYDTLATESGFLNGISGGYIEGSPIMRDGEQITQGQYSMETAVRDNKAMMEFMKGARRGGDQAAGGAGTGREGTGEASEGATGERKGDRVGHPRPGPRVPQLGQRRSGGPGRGANRVFRCVGYWWVGGKDSRWRTRLHALRAQDPLAEGRSDPARGRRPPVAGHLSGCH